MTNNIIQFKKPMQNAYQLPLDLSEPFECIMLTNDEDTRQLVRVACGYTIDQN